MAIGFWFSILKLLLGLAANVAGTIRTKQAMDAGGQRELAKMLKAISVEAGISRTIEIETAAMSPEQVLRDLQDSGELRD
jgi:hypothetical protein